MNGYTHTGLNSLTNDDGDKVDSRHPSYIAMGPKYKLINTLLGGTDAIRAAGVDYLPMFPNEESDTYLKRKSKSFLNPSFAVAVESHSSKPFSSPVVIDGHLDDKRLSRLLTDTDGIGNDITEFSKRLFVDADQYGMTHILADYSVGTARSLAEELNSDTFARLVHIRCLDLFYWDSDSRGLTEIRYHLEATVPNGDFGRKQVKRIMRWQRDSWQVWEERSVNKDNVEDCNTKDGKKINPDDNMWVMIESGINSLGVIPLTTVYFKRKGFMEAEPPNYELAEVCLEHYQDMSDQKRLESIARVGLLVATGFDKQDLDNFSISANTLVESSATEAKLSIVEHSGSAVTIGRNSLKILEDKMEELSLKPELNRTSGDVTATGVLANAFNSCSDLLSWTNSLETGLIEAFRMAYSFIGEELPEDFKLSIYKDFTVVGNVSDLDKLIELHRGGALDRQTILFEFQRRGSLNPALNIQDIMDRAVAEDEEKLKREMTLIESKTKEKPSEENNKDNKSNESIISE